MITYPLCVLGTTTAWGVVLSLFSALQRRSFLDESASPALARLYTLATVFTFVGVGLLPFASFAFGGGSMESALQHVVANSIAAALVGGIVLRSMQSSYVAAFGPRGSRGKVRMGGNTLVGGVGSILMLVSLGNWISLETAVHARRGDAVVAIAAFLALGLALIVGQRRLSGVGAKGALLPLEDSPLAHELAAIAAHFGQDAGKLKVQTTRPDGEAGAELSPAQVAVIMRTWRFRRRSPWIPIELIQRVEPREVTAAVAIRYALVTPRHRGRLAPRLVAFAVLATATIIMISVANAAAAPRLGGAAPIVLAMTMGAGFGVMLVWLPRRLGLTRDRVQSFVAAHEAWRAAAECEPRDFVEFTVALLASDRLTLMLGADADMIPFVRKNREIQNAATLASGLSPEEFLGKLRARTKAGPGVAQGGT